MPIITGRDLHTWRPIDTWMKNYWKLLNQNLRETRYKLKANLLWEWGGRISEFGKCAYVEQRKPHLQFTEWNCCAQRLTSDCLVQCLRQAALPLDSMAILLLYDICWPWLELVIDTSDGQHKTGAKAGREDEWKEMTSDRRYSLYCKFLVLIYVGRVWLWKRLHYCILWENCCRASTCSCCGDGALQEEGTEAGSFPFVWRFHSSRVKLSYA